LRGTAPLEPGWPIARTVPLLRSANVARALEVQEPEGKSAAAAEEEEEEEERAAAA
jgi:hypothetical protein